MQDKKLFPVFFSILLFLAAAPLALAQEESETQANYYIARDENDDILFIQRLTWQNTDHVLRYVAIVEQLDRNNFIEVLRQETEESYIEVSLTAGRYRYCVEVYDLFDELFHTTSWREFEIQRAYRPEVSSFYPGGFYLDEDDTWVVTLRGNYLFQESVYYLIRGNTIITPESFTADRNSARLTFSENSLIPGRYDVYVKNPGGLDTQQGAFTIAYRKPVDFNISLMYSPLIPAYGFHFIDSDLEAPFPDIFYPLSAGARMSLLTFKRPWGYMGAELSGSFSYLKHEKEFYTTEGYLINAHLSYLYQLYFMKKTFSINISAGAGITYLMETVYIYPVGSPTDGFSAAYPSLLGSVSFTWFFNKPFYLTAGADYTQMFIAPEDGSAAGFIRLFLGVGIQL